MKRPSFKRPTLGGPSIKAPAPLAELVADLRERRLLPIAVALLVGIIAVPIAVSASGGSSAPPPAPGAVAGAAPISQEGNPAVLAYDPGLRDYRDRLSALQAKNPFAQRFAPPDVDGEALSSVAATDAGGGSTTVSSSTTSGSGTISFDQGGSGDGGGGGGGGSGPGETRYVSYTVVLQVGEAGGKMTQREARPFDFLPSASIPVAVFLNAGGGGKTALFLVSSDVSDVSGDGVCTLGEASCAVLVLKPGDVADLTFAPDGRTYRIRVREIEQVISSKPAG